MADDLQLRMQMERVKERLIMIFTPAGRSKLRLPAIIFALFLGIVGFYVRPVLADTTTTPATKEADTTYKSQRSIVFTKAAPEIMPLYTEYVRPPRLGRQADLKN